MCVLFRDFVIFCQNLRVIVDSFLDITSSGDRRSDVLSKSILLTGRLKLRTSIQNVRKILLEIGTCTGLSCSGSCHIRKNSRMQTCASAGNECNASVPFVNFTKQLCIQHFLPL